MQFSSYFFICSKNFTWKKIIYQIVHFTWQFCPQLSNFLHWTQCHSIEVLTKYTFALEIFRNFAYLHLITRLLHQRFGTGFEQSTRNKMRLLRQSNCNREILFHARQDRPSYGFANALQFQNCGYCSVNNTTQGPTINMI